MTTAQAVAAIERVIVAASQSEFSAQTIQAARDALDFLLAENQALRESKQHESARAHSLRERAEQAEAERDELQKLPFMHSKPEDCPCWYDYCHCNVDTLRDQIKRAADAETDLATAIGQNEQMLNAVGVENFPSFLIRIAELESERDALRLSLNTTNVIVNDQIGKIADLIKERDAAIEDVREMIGEMEHESNTQHAAALDLQAQRDAAIADARNASRLMDILEKYSNVIFTGDDREIAVSLLDKYLNK